MKLKIEKNLIKKIKKNQIHLKTQQTFKIEFIYENSTIFLKSDFLGNSRIKNQPFGNCFFFIIF